MTMPSERTRALRWAGDFLRDVASSPAVSEDLKNEAQRILRHYPSTQEIQRALHHAGIKTDIGGPWLAPEDAERD
jgi:hypothetical protein